MIDGPSAMDFSAVHGLNSSPGCACRYRSEFLGNGKDPVPRCLRVLRDGEGSVGAELFGGTPMPEIPAPTTMTSWCSARTKAVREVESSFLERSGHGFASEVADLVVGHMFLKYVFHGVSTSRKHRT